MTIAAEAYLKLIESGEITLPEDAVKQGYWVMQDCAPISHFIKSGDYLWCPFYPWAKSLSHNFEHSISEELCAESSLNHAVVFPSKQADEMLIMAAAAIKSLEPGGRIFLAAANDAGGNRLKKILDRFAIESIESHSKNKCKIVTGIKKTVTEDRLNEALLIANTQPILDGRFVSQIGLYGWNKEDAGSRLLAEMFPEDIFGHGADFGCGYGYLSHAVLEKCRKVKTLKMIDAERRALTLAQENVKDHGTKTHVIWDDLVKPHHPSKGLDFIVMNPPFHGGKKADHSIGSRFIESAHVALKRYGVLYMVSNTHLPYEQTVSKLFHKFEVVIQKNGFKVIFAYK